jgi:hypothetical protein
MHVGFNWTMWSRIEKKIKMAGLFIRVNAGAVTEIVICGNTTIWEART